MSRILAISDLHAPFQHKSALNFLEAVADTFQIDRVVCMGDELDNHYGSYHDTDPDGLGGGQEIELALEFMEQLYELFPEAEVCVGNHTSLSLRKAYSHGIPRHFMKDFSDFMEAPEGWSWHDRVEIDGIVFEHGDAGPGGMYAHIKQALINMKPTVLGHFHSNAGVIYQANQEKLLWGLATGCLVDTQSYAMRYGRKFSRKPILGSGVILDGHPLFVPMHLGKSGRWTKKITAT